MFGEESFKRKPKVKVIVKDNTEEVIKVFTNQLDKILFLYKDLETRVSKLEKKSRTKPIKLGDTEITEFLKGKVIHKPITNEQLKVYG